MKQLLMYIPLMKLFNQNNFFAGLMVLQASFSYACENSIKKELHLHFDVNKTIIATDAVQCKSLDAMVNGILAEFTTYAWDGITEQSFYAYATDSIAKANPDIPKASEQFKKKRIELIKQFPAHLKQYSDLYATYEQEKATMLHILNQQEMVIFPSFFKLLQWLHTQSTYKIALYLRTFGKDLPEVVPLIEKISSLRFAHAQCKAGRIYTEVEQLVVDSTGLSPQEFFNNKECSHYAIQDDYAHWKSHGFQAAGGKPFLIDESNPNILSLFFDDNADDADKPIICPLDMYGVVLDTKELIKKGTLIAVNPKEAILDEDYFIKKVKSISF